MSAYLIANVDIHDVDKINDYFKATLKIIKNTRVDF